MCGIVGFWNKSNDESAPLGRIYGWCWLIRTIRASSTS
jgi:hypothetical protein